MSKQNLIRSNFQLRRLINITVLVLACVALSLLLSLLDTSFASASEWSGWLLFSSAIVLLLYSARKRLSMLPIGLMSGWLQVHIYFGFFSLFLFASHLQWHLPSGWFEIALATSFIGTILTGILGIYWSRTLPKVISRLPQDVLFERISGFVRQTRQQAEDLVLDSAKQTGSAALFEFYQRWGANYFDRPRFHWRLLLQSYDASYQIRHELAALDKFLPAADLPIVEQLSELIEVKNLLDSQYTLQGALKHWLLIHLVFAMSVLPLVLLHIVLIYSFTSL